MLGTTAQQHDMTDTKYKHTELGPIPQHWELRQWQYLLQENVTTNTDCKETHQLQFKYGDIVSKVNQEVDADTLKIISKYTKVQPNDIMINGLNLNYDFISQRIGMVRTNGIITSAYISLRPTEEANPSYYNYLLKAMDAQKMFHGMGTGVRLTLSYKELKNKYLPFPPLDEQEAMVAYLDEQTGKIDAAIEREQKMIDLLNERKQIIIQQAVTKGLNPNAPMKDSGIEWIGKIPEGWEVRKLKYIGKLQSGDTINSDYFTESGYPVYGGNGFRGYTDRYTNDGDFVLIGRQGALCGNVNYASGKFFASEHAIVVHPKCRNENITWLGNAIKASNLNQYSQSAAQPGLAVSMIQNISYPFPPEEEREQIGGYIAKVITEIDKATKPIEKLIFLLQERKQIIINEVVTGKIKVS